MKTVTLEIDEATDERLAALAQRCDATPGQFIDMLCSALDRSTLERVIQQTIGEVAVTSEPGIARLPERPSSQVPLDFEPLSRTEVTPL
jgi:predicted transcriptional regulator